MKRQLFGAPVSSATGEEAVEGLLSQSRGMNGRSCLPRDTRRWLSGLEPQLPERFWVHDDAASRQAARRLGVAGFMRRDRIFLGEGLAERRERVLRHELVHLAQVQVALRTGRVSSSEAIEAEADAIGSAGVAYPVRCGADPRQFHPFVWLVPIAVGLYILLRPSVANAPGPGDAIERSPSAGQIVAESLCLFVVPGGAIGIGGRLGLGFLGRSALAGAATTTSLRITGDVSSGQMSPPLLYVFDVVTGAAVGWIVPGGVRVIGRVGTYAFERLDALATVGFTKTSLALSKALHDAVVKTPMTAEQAEQFLRSRGLAGDVSSWWLERRNLVVLFRGQETATTSIVSPLARRENVAASEALVAQLRSLGVADKKIATWTARYHTQPITGADVPPSVAGQRLGSVGIPTTGSPGIAADFAKGPEGVIYVIRMPRNLVIRPDPWQLLKAEDERVIFNQIPPGSIVQVISADEIPPLMVNERGLLVPAP
jgi:hypothetical protein